MASRKRQVARSLTIGRRPRCRQEGRVVIMTAEQLIATVDLQLSIFNLQPSNHSFLEKNEFENESISCARATSSSPLPCSPALKQRFPRPLSFRSSKKINSKTNHGPRSTVHFIRYP
jgi:hypothetical protein